MNSINVYIINWDMEAALCCPTDDYHSIKKLSSD